MLRPGRWRLAEELAEALEQRASLGDAVEAALTFVAELHRAAVARAGVLERYEHRAWRCGWRERRQTADVPDRCPRCGKLATYAMPVPRRVNFHGLRYSFEEPSNSGAFFGRGDWM